jgi:hypothetical protein
MNHRTTRPAAVFAIALALLLPVFNADAADIDADALPLGGQNE